LRAGDDFGRLVVKLDHVSITVDDIETSEIFYDAVMAALNIPKVKRSKAQLGYGERADANHPGRGYISILRGDQPEPAFRRHWCFKAESRAAVDAFWHTGIGYGGSDDGAPGSRLN
jgi:catechol 2,3-dioxygenase-like lactoylglutathione lyase family enzyme